jgi:PP-loop superfamily ATP-utilizing enzyme
LLAQQAGLPNHALPANSCLATRVGSGRRIEARLLQHIDMAEAFLHRSGYPGSRFRLVQNDIHLEIRHEEMERFQREDIRSAFQTYVSDLGYGFNFNNVTCRQYDDYFHCSNFINDFDLVLASEDRFNYCAHEKPQYPESKGL